jgi:flagellar basal body P-ring formation protein FlgA
MKFISSVGKSASIFGLYAGLCLASNLSLASQNLSGAMIKAEIKSSLASLGMATDPAINQDRQFLPCAAGLTIEPMFGSYKTVRVSCSDLDGFSIAVRTQIQTDTSVAVLDGDAGDASQLSSEAPKIVKLSRSLRRGEVITNDDLVLVSSPDHRLVGYFEDLDDVIGRKAKRSLSVNQALQNRHLEMDWLVQKDQNVTIETQIGGVTVTGSGLALDNAQMGDLLKVLNQSSKVIVEGRVVSEKKVKIITK